MNHKQVDHFIFHDNQRRRVRRQLELEQKGVAGEAVVSIVLFTDARESQSEIVYSQAANTYEQLSLPNFVACTSGSQ
ncbi:hypothetical protein OUZ56_027679 [Daphnia magna]|uniref:Uncharacterized protein n=1 Tax=Daphnia magna TaxID=35525 RepID=A0ABR0B1P6_9CRUS|nr:hypothetical protein OUZ56_027679 [Daphnia magna]